MSTFYLIDFDFTLFKTHSGSSIFIEELAKAHPDEALEIERRVAESLVTGISFAIRDATVELIGEQETRVIEAQYIERARSERLLFDGAHEVMNYIETHDARFGILTYGSVLGQTMKIHAAQLADVPFMITDRKKKGELIAEWWRDDQFVIPELLGGGNADEIVLVDDRLFSFEGLPPQARGYWVQTGPARYDPVTDAPARVQSVDTLLDVIAAEEARLNTVD